MRLVTRDARVETTKMKGMQFLVAKGCPKLLEGHAFYACRCNGDGVPAQDKPSIEVTCEFLKGVTTRHNGDKVVACAYGGTPNPGSGVQFGTPTVSHVVDESDGGHPD